MKRLMKPLFALTVICFLAISANAQQYPWRLGIGVSGGIGTQDPNPFVLGGDLRLQKGLGNSVSVIFTTGYTNFFKKAPYSNMGFVPLKAGFKVFPIKNFYLNAEAGAGFGTTKGLGTSFVWSPAVGFAFGSGWDVSVKSEDFTKYEYTKQVALRLAYGFKL